jgi:hypothetical protein
MANITLRANKANPLTIAEVDANFTNLNIDKLETSEYTGEKILIKLKTVDGATSGLDADFLRGLAPEATNVVSSIVQRDASGNFTAGIITATLTGNASTVTNGVVTTGNYSDPSWITGLSGGKLTDSTVANAKLVDATITGAKLADLTVTNAKIADTTIANGKLANSKIAINGTDVSLGGTIDFRNTSTTFTAEQIFRDNAFSITNAATTSKVLKFDLSTAVGTRTLTVPNANGTIALTSDISALCVARGFITFTPSTGTALSSKNLTVVRNSTGVYTITLDSTIRPGDTSYAPIVSAIDSGNLQTQSTAIGSMDIRTIGVDTLTTSTFVVRAIRRYNSAVAVSPDIYHSWTAEVVDPARITVVVY